MRRLLLAAPLLALAACGGTPQSVVSGAAATISAAVLPPAQLAQVQQLCAASAPLLTAANAAPNATVSSTAVDALAYCQQLAAAPPGQVPATTNSNTPSWLPAVISAAQVAAQIAGIVLPMLL